MSAIESVGFVAITSGVSFALCSFLSSMPDSDSDCLRYRAGKITC